MRKVILLLLISLTILMISCSDDITVVLEKENGAISGHVTPADSEAKIELYQYGKIKETMIDNNGYFLMEDVEPGSYSIQVKADSFGTYYKDRIKVEDAETTSIPEISLSRLPYPIRNITYNCHFSSNYSIFYSYNCYFSLYFYEAVDISEVEEALEFEPEIHDLELDYSYSTNNNRVDVSINCAVQTDYIMHISGLHTNNGTELEFPYHYEFSTPDFSVGEPDIDLYNYYYSSHIPHASFDFNSSVSTANINSYFSISDNLEFYSSFDNDNRNVDIIPSLSCWPSDSLITITISEDLSDVNGNTLGEEKSFQFVSPPLQIETTIPENYSSNVVTGTEIALRFNNKIEEPDFNEDINITPEIDIVDFRLEGGNLYLVPDTLTHSTTYEINVNTSINDLYGVELSQPYTFQFTTESAE